MTRQLTPIDISNFPDLVRIAEEVRATQKPRTLLRDKRPLAVLTPLTQPQPHQTEKTAVEKAVALAGAWSDLPSDHLEEELHRIRHSSKPTAPLEL